MLLENKEVKVTEVYPKIQSTILKILNDDQVPRNDWRDLFEAIHNVFTWDNDCDEMFALLKEDIRNFVIQQKRLIEGKTGEALMNEYGKQYRKIQKMICQLQLPFHKVFASTNRICLVQKVTGRDPIVPDRKSDTYDEKSIIRELVIDAWETIVFNDIAPRLRDATLEAVNIERSGGPAQSQLIKTAQENFLEFVPETSEPRVAYLTYFEEPYLADLSNTYGTQTVDYLAKYGIIEYMRYADKMWLEEWARGLKYLDNYPESRLKLRQCITNEFVRNYLDQIHDACPGLIKDKDTKMLAVMFSLLDRMSCFDTPEDDADKNVSIRALEPMLTCIHKHLTTQGIAEMRAEAEQIAANSQKYVEFILGMYERNANFVRAIAGTDQRFNIMRAKAYREILSDSSVFAIQLPEGRARARRSDPESRCPELLASYYDLLLKRSAVSKKLTNDQIKEKLEEVSGLIRYITNTDIFIESYKKGLTRRLIMNTSHDVELENFTLALLGKMSQFTDDAKSMERMFQDIATSQEISKKFNSFLDKNNSKIPRGLLDIKILTHGSWKCVRDEKLPMTLPVELEGLVPQMEDFYRAEHANKDLYWQHHMSDGVVTFKSSKGVFDLEVTTVQMAVLFAWNLRREEKIPLEGLHLATDLPEGELRRTLFSLVNCPKMSIQILVCDQPTFKTPKDFTKQTEFWLNHDFCIMRGENSLDRGTVSLMPKTYINEKTADESSKDIAFLRANRTTEAILAVMKEHKALNYAELQMKTIEKLSKHFAPTQRLMKDSLIDLITVDAVKRDAKDVTKYTLVI